MPTTTATSSARPIRPRRHAEGHEDRRHGDRQEEQDPVDDTPAHRAEDPLPDQQRRPDDGEEDREDDEHEGQAAERRDLPDLAGDRAGFGLGELDVRHRERDQGVARRRELCPQARRGRARARVGPPGDGSTRVGGVGGVGWFGLGASRVVLRAPDRARGQRR